MASCRWLMVFLYCWIWLAHPTEYIFSRKVKWQHCKTVQMLSKCCPSCKKWATQVSERLIRVIRLGLHISFFRTGLRRWRSVFLCPTTGYLTRASKSAFCGRRKLFFVRSSPLRERALDGRVPYEKSTQRKLSAFALSWSGQDSNLWPTA